MIIVSVSEPWILRSSDGQICLWQLTISFCEGEYFLSVRWISSHTHTPLRLYAPRAYIEIYKYRPLKNNENYWWSFKSAINPHRRRNCFVVSIYCLLFLLCCPLLSPHAQCYFPVKVCFKTFILQRCSSSEEDIMHFLNNAFSSLGVWNSEWRVGRWLRRVNSCSSRRELRVNGELVS